MLEAICPGCDSIRTVFDSDAAEDVETGYCRDCGAGFALAETVVGGRGVWTEVVP